MSHQELIAKMRGRIEMCRRLAASTTDSRTAQTLREMAEEGERDVERLQAEEAEIVIGLTPPDAL
jgi:hypothetical protein